MKNTESKALDLNADQTNKENSSNEQLFVTEDIEGTPFTMVDDDNMGGSFIAYGRHVITKIAATPDEYVKLLKQKDELQKFDWEILLNAIGVIIELRLNDKK